MKCLKCGYESDNLTWDYELHANTGKWKLSDKQLERLHTCKRKPKPESKPKKDEMTICPKCDPLSPDRYILKSKLQEHIKKEHIDWGNYNE